jgi:hypothetical protein
MLLASLMALTLAPQAAQIDPVLQAQIGSDDGGLEEVFGRVSDLAADPDGNVYVLDALADRVRVFSSSGRYQTTFGRSGRGAGELSRPIRIDVRNGIATVLNPSGQASSYTLRGGPVDSQALPFGSQGAVRIGEGRYVVLVPGSVARRDPTPTESLIVVEPNARDTLTTVPTTDVLFRSPTLTSSMRTSVCRLVHFVVGDDAQLWVASGLDGTLTEWRVGGGTPERGRSVEVAPRSVPLPDSVRAAVMSMVPPQLDPAVGDLYLPELLGSICGFERSSDGTLWIRLADVGGSELWRSYDPETLQPMVELTAPEGVTISAFSGTLAYGIQVDAARVTRVMVYRIG